MGIVIHQEGPGRSDIPFHLSAISFMQAGISQNKPHPQTGPGRLRGLCPKEPEYILRLAVVYLQLRNGLVPDTS